MVNGAFPSILQAEVRQFWTASMLLRELLATNRTARHTYILKHRIGDMRARLEIVMPRPTYERPAIISELRDDVDLIGSMTESLLLRSRCMELSEIANDNIAKTA